MRPSTSGKTSRKLATASSADPVPSSRARAAAAGRAGSARAPTARAKIPSGRLIRNSARQSVPSRSALSSTPATIGPATVDRPMTGPSAAKALLICAGGKRSRISPKACGVISAAARPCSTRAAISDPADGASAHAADASTNPARPVISIRLRPNMSPSRPPAIRPAAMARV